MGLRPSLSLEEPEGGVRRQEGTAFLAEQYRLHADRVSRLRRLGRWRRPALKLASSPGDLAPGQVPEPSFVSVGRLDRGRLPCA